jgi:hypothetical protein
MNVRALFFPVLLAFAANSSAQAPSQSPFPTPSQPKPQAAKFTTVAPISSQDLFKVGPTIFTTQPSFTLVAHGPQAHPADIWLRSTDDGLHIWGKVQVDQKDIHWPGQKSEMLSGDHIEVWLATSPSVPMPAIGWGNQFGAQQLASLKDCTGQRDNSGDDVAGMKNCERWYNEQIQYREHLQRLFVRQWLISTANYQQRSFEDFASTAYAALNASLFPKDLPIALQPKPDDGVTSEINGEFRQEIKQDAAGNPIPSGHMTGYTFHVFIPYTAFPPARQLKLTELYLMVDVFSSAPDGRKMGDYASISPARKWGDPATFNHLRLAAPRTFSVSPCDDNPQQTDLYGDSFESWFFPTAPGKDSDIRSTFALINPEEGYLYAPGRVSPQADQLTYFWKQLVGGATVCGPNLAWRNGETIKRTKFLIGEKYLETKTLPDGWSLIRSGPFTSTHSPFGSGQCGSCEVFGFNLFAVSPHGDITSALDIDQDLSGEGGSPQAADLTIAPDWKKITLFLEYEDDEQKDPKSNWTSTTYCLVSHAYEQCGQSKEANPPEPANFKELRGSDGS